MTLGLRHVAAAAFVVAASSVFQHADAQPCDDLSALAIACGEDATCSDCAAAGADPAYSDCIQTIDFLQDDCGVLNSLACCSNEVSGIDCLANDLWWELSQCNSDGITCESRTCEGTGSETSPTPSTTTTPAPAAGGGSETTDLSSAANEDCIPLFATCAADETCAACAILEGDSLDLLVECLEAVDFADVCGAQTANMCCYSEVSGQDCLSNDAFWEYLRCPDFGADQTCDTRSCGATGGGGGGGGAAPTPTTAATPAPAAGARGETVAPSAAADDSTVAPAAASSAASSATAAPADASFMTAAPSSAASSPDATPEPTSPAERAIDTTAGPTTTEEAEESDASGTTSGAAGLGASWSPVGMAVAGLAAAVALVGV